MTTERILAGVDGRWLGDDLVDPDMYSVTGCSIGFRQWNGTEMDRAVGRVTAE